MKRHAQDQEGKYDAPNHDTEFTMNENRGWQQGESGHVHYTTVRRLSAFAYFTTSLVGWGRRIAAGKGARYAARHHSWFEHRLSPSRRALAAGGRQLDQGGCPRVPRASGPPCPGGPRLAPVVTVLILAHLSPAVLLTRLARRRLDATASAPGNITSHHG